MKTHWLASYPKSGNTWFRVFIANLLYPDKAPVDPNQLPLNTLIASARSPFHEIVGTPAALLTADECESLRPDIDNIIGDDWAGPVCLRKTHDAYTYLSDGRPLMGRRPDFAAIYILRNPWDVAVSAANHLGISLEQSVDRLCARNTTFSNKKDRIDSQIRQRLLSWSGHVKSWLAAPLDICFIRYEEMHAQPLETFQRAVRFLGVSSTDAEITAAIDASSFARLCRIEQERGFGEATKHGSFFRAGRVGEGRRLLSVESLRKLDQQNETVERLLEHFLKHREETVL